MNENFIFEIFMIETSNINNNLSAMCVHRVVLYYMYPGHEMTIFFDNFGYKNKNT